MPRNRRLDSHGGTVPEGERRQLAVLFCDVVESTPLSQRLDAEEFGELMLDFQELATDTITGLGGSIGVYAGDGVAAWFGWPVAHEDDAALAAQAGLDTFRSSRLVRMLPVARVQPRRTLTR